MLGMNIRVILQDGQEKEVKPYQLDKLISLRMVRKFRRSGRWVTMGKDRTRGKGGNYTGTERRRHLTVKFL
ncbi:MAG: hypothetical protein A2Y97_04260 [Nitrospirae bacterium RBG_13_39_12]|nr:MAG: hypothetical protein A2Y97_04260 [Nitrospirae bacterium RBG_13_39_12]